MEAKLKNINLIVGPCKKMPDIAVIMGLPFDCSKHVLNNLKSNSPSDVLTAGVEESALGYALYEVIRDKFVGSPLHIAKSRVSRVDCDFITGNFVITWNTQGSLSMLRKTIGLALSTFDPAKLYSKYAENMKLLGGSNNRDVFNYCAGEMINSIKKGITIAVSGKINMTPEKLKELLSKVDNKAPSMTAVPKGTKPEKRDEYKTEYPTIKATGIAAVVISDYIRSKSGGMSVAVDTNHIVVYNKSWPTKYNTLKGSDRIKDYVRQKYEKLDDSFACVLAYMSITQGYADCHTVMSIIKSKPSAKSMIDLIKKHM